MKSPDSHGASTDRRALTRRVQWQCSTKAVHDAIRPQIDTQTQRMGWIPDPNETTPLGMLFPQPSTRYHGNREIRGLSSVSG